MPTGEERWRLRPKSPFLVTFASHLTLGASGGWQEAHFHTGLEERYLVLYGKVGFVKRSRDPGSQDSIEYGLMTPDDGPFSFAPSEEHNIFVAPGAEFATFQLRAGQSIPNPDRKGEDWWPATKFDAGLGWYYEEVEKTL